MTTARATTRPGDGPARPGDGGPATARPDDAGPDDRGPADDDLVSTVPAPRSPSEQGVLDLPDVPTCLS